MPATARGFRYPAATDTPDVPRDLGNLAADVDAMWAQGTFAARPAFGKVGREYYATDTTDTWLDIGTAWVLKGTGALVRTTDARLSDTRVPTDGSVTDAKVAAGAAIAPGKIAGTAVVNADARLSDQRTPLDGSVTWNKLFTDIRPPGGGGVAGAANYALRKLGNNAEDAMPGKFPNNVWLPSAEGNNRLHFASGGRSYYQGIGGHEFQNSTGAAILTAQDDRSVDIAGGPLRTYSLDTHTDMPWTGGLSPIFKMPGALSTGRKTRFIKTQTADASFRKLSLFWFSRSNVDWSSGHAIEVIIRQEYFNGSGYVRALISGGYSNAPKVTVLETNDPGVWIPKLSAETTVSGNIKETEVFLNLQAYVRVSVEINYSHEDVAARPFTNNGQIFFTGTESVLGADPGQAGGHMIVSAGFPANPYDGQIIFWPADEANGVVWQLRYRAGASNAMKWEFVGGHHLWKEDATQRSTTSNVYAVAFGITVPVTGDYEIEFGTKHSWLSSGATFNAAHLATFLNGSLHKEVPAGSNAGSDEYTPMFHKYRSNMTGGQSFQLCYRAAHLNAYTAYFAGGYLGIKLIRA